MATASEREIFERHVTRGSDALKAGKLEDATAQLKAALAIEPSSSRVLALLGLAHFRGGALDMARPIYEDLVERLPTDASHRLNLGLVYLKLGDADRAITSLEASRALDPSQGRAISYLGLAYARAGRFAEAYRSFMLAGQNDLAQEIEQNLTPAERGGINAQLGGRTPTPQPPPAPAPVPAPEPAIARAVTPRTKPPSAPPRPEPKDLSSRSFPEIVIEKATDKPSGSTGIPQEAPPRMTESMQFVLGKGEVKPVPVETPARVDISQAIAATKPAPIPSAHDGSQPIPLSQLATTELIHIDDGDQVFELGAGGALLVRVTERVITRLDGVFVTGGELAFEPATRRSRGHQTEERIDYGGTPMVAATGTGYLLALPGDQTFVPITLDDDILYVREDLLFAFEGTLRWETGHVPGLRGQMPVVQFRGDGSLVLRLAKPLVRVKLPAQGVVYVDVTRLGGWIGRVIPRAVVPAAGGPLGELGIECTGEGIVLVEPSGAPSRPSIDAPHRRDSEPAIATQPAPAAPPPPPATSAGPEDAHANESAAQLMAGIDDDDDPQRDQI